MSNKGDIHLVVIGGGPGGSTAATLVARQGHRVVLLEKEKFPRYQIGESLLPSTVHGICAMLGVAEEIAKAGFQRKLGGSFRWGTRADPWSFNFGSAEAIGESRGYAYQVERARFDEILLENARRRGVDVREECSVSGVIRDNGRVAGVIYTDGRGVQHELRARFVIDASGNTSRLHREAGERIFSRYFQNVALFGYYENGRRLPSPNEGNILCAAFDRGWFWYIPLTSTLTSVGAVVAKEEASIIASGQEKAMDDFIASCPIIRDYLAGATRIREGRYGQLRIRKDYSYSNSRFWIPGLLLVGDAACFIDPVFSSGVHLATYSALLASRSVNTLLAGDTIDEAAALGEFERRYRREFANFYDFLVSFYDMNQNENSYFWRARSILKTEERANEAFIRLVGGAANADEFFRRREGIGTRIQHLTDGDPQGNAGGVPNWGQENFVPGFRDEHVQIANQALHGDTREPELPLFEDGLIPSRDGFHWEIPQR